MPVAYTPGLRVTGEAALHLVRRLPMQGEVLVQVGDVVTSETVVACAEMPGNLHSVRVAQQLHLEPNELPGHMTVHVGQAVQAGDTLARTQGLWGLLKSEVKSPVAGTVEEVSLTSGHARIREAPRRIEVLAHCAGTVSEVLPDEGAVIATRGALVQGIFGVGGERRGKIVMATSGPDQRLVADALPECQGCVLVAGSGLDGEAIRRAAAAGATGLVVGAVSDEALRQYVGYDIGVAITGQEDVPMTLLLTEGFGELPMAHRTWELLASLAGQLASVNGATQIRAGVIRPEILVPREHLAADVAAEAPAQILQVGARVRLIREPHFGLLGRVSGLPSELTEIETESHVRIATITLDRGDTVPVPRANLELIQE
jgi:hypothetical protein